MGLVELYGIVSADDGSTYEAKETAKKFLGHAAQFDAAIVDFTDGLVLCDSARATAPESEGGEITGIHFRSPNCGYGGNGPYATARILEMYGFGEFDTLFHHITQGGNMAHFTFTRAKNHV
jgi:hypothetical protein